MDLMIFRNHRRTLIKTDDKQQTTKKKNETTSNNNNFNEKTTTNFALKSEREFERTGGFTSGLFSTSHFVF